MTESAELELGEELDGDIVETVANPRMVADLDRIVGGFFGRGRK